MAKEKPLNIKLIFLYMWSQLIFKHKRDLLKKKKKRIAMVDSSNPCVVSNKNNPYPSKAYDPHIPNTGSIWIKHGIYILLAFLRAAIQFLPEVAQHWHTGSYFQMHYFPEDIYYKCPISKLTQSD